MTAMHARVLRDGRQIEISAEDIVPGDVLFVKGGDILPADGFIITSAGLMVDEALLTGESAAVEKSEMILLCILAHLRSAVRRRSV